MYVLATSEITQIGILGLFWSRELHTWEVELPSCFWSTSGPAKTVMELRIPHFSSAEWTGFILLEYWAS